MVRDGNTSSLRELTCRLLTQCEIKTRPPVCPSDSVVGIAIEPRVSSFNTHSLRKHQGNIFLELCNKFKFKNASQPVAVDQHNQIRWKDGLPTPLVLHRSSAKIRNHGLRDIFRMQGVNNMWDPSLLHGKILPLGCQSAQSSPTCPCPCHNAVKWSRKAEENEAT